MLQSLSPLFPEYIRLNARWNGEADAIIAPGGSLTWRALVERSDRVASGLRAMGLTDGDRVGATQGVQPVGRHLSDDADTQSGAREGLAGNDFLR